MSAEFGKRFKVLLVGGDNTGKTSFLNKIVKGEFSQNCKPSTVLDYQNKIMETEEGKVTLVCWDIPGNEKFRRIFTSNLRGSEAVLVFYGMVLEKNFRLLTDFWPICGSFLVSLIFFY